MTTKHVQFRENEGQRQTSQECTLDGVRVRIVARYTATQDRWFANIFALDGSLILGGLACVPGIDMLRPYKHLAIPQGALFCSTANREPPTFETIDSSARVLYRTVS